MGRGRRPAGPSGGRRLPRIVRSKGGEAASRHRRAPGHSPVEPHLNAQTFWSRNGEAASRRRRAPSQSPVEPHLNAQTFWSQVKVYALSDTLAAYREPLSGAIHAALVEAIQLPHEKRFQRFIPLEPENFIFPAGRSERYTIIEIVMFSGRSVAAKKELIRSLYTFVAERTPIGPMDLEITLIEMPRENWGIRGQNGEDLQLDYRLQV